MTEDREVEAEDFDKDISELGEGEDDFTSIQAANANVEMRMNANAASWTLTTIHNVLTMLQTPITTMS
jgi:hypothetical protein